VEHRQLVDYVEHFVVDPWTDNDDYTTSSDSQSQSLTQAIDDNVSISGFFTARRYAIARLLSSRVCPSVCPFVTNHYYIKTANGPSQKQRHTIAQGL